MTILDSEQLSSILERGEGRQVEFKEGLAADGRVARTICAFANTRGGVLLIGVTDKGVIRGVPRPAAVAVRVRDLAARAVEPPVDARIEVLRTGSGSVVCCSVPLSPSRPHAVVRGAAAGGPEILVRSGSSNREASPDAAASLAAEVVKKASLTPVEARILTTLQKQPPLTIGAFARDQAIGKQKARQAFERLERAGLLVAHGLGERRGYELA